MFEKKESHERNGQGSQQFPELNEEIESIICRLHQLTDRVARLRLNCQEFRNTTLETKTLETKTLETKLEQTGNTRCNSCGHALDPREGVAVKNSDGIARAYYHVECFRALLSTSLPSE